MLLKITKKEYFLFYFTQEMFTGKCMDWIEVVLGIILMLLGWKSAEKTRSDFVALASIIVAIAGFLLLMKGFGLIGW